MPLACRLPKICDGFGSLMRFQTMDCADGWLKMVVSPAAMLKLCQLRNAFCDAVMVSCEPVCDGRRRAGRHGHARRIGRRAFNAKTQSGKDAKPAENDQ